MQFEARFFQTQFSFSADKLYEWNIDGLFEQEIINKMSHMSMVIAYQNNHDLDLPEIVNLLVIGFSGQRTQQHYTLKCLRLLIKCLLI